MRLFASALALLVSSCAAGEGRSTAPSPRLSPDAHIIDPKYMRARCTIVDEEGNQVKTLEPCPDYQVPPVELIARFEARLPGLLAAKGDHIPKLSDYVRQYWGVLRDGRLYVEGQLVCRSHAVHFPGPPEEYDDQQPIPGEQLAQGPLIIDDAGICLLEFSFPADQPNAIDFP